MLTSQLLKAWSGVDLFHIQSLARKTLVTSLPRLLTARWVAPAQAADLQAASLPAADLPVACLQAADIRKANPLGILAPLHSSQGHITLGVVMLLLPWGLLHNDEQQLELRPCSYTAGKALPSTVYWIETIAY